MSEGQLSTRKGHLLSEIRVVLLLGAIKTLTTRMRSAIRELSRSKRERPPCLVTCHVASEAIFCRFITHNSLHRLICRFVIQNSFYNIAYKRRLSYCMQTCYSSRLVSFRHSCRSCDFSPVCTTWVEQICHTGLHSA